MKLEPNMYVRTKDGIILKVNDIEDIYTTYNIFVGMCIYDNEGHFINDVEITKASHNIIDLIEVGDYVNGEKVGYIDDCDGSMREYYYDYEDASIDVGHFFEEIISIVTKEQFESMSYKVGEDK